MGRITLLLPEAEASQGLGVNSKDILQVQVGFIIALIYISGNQNGLINDCYACLQVPSKQLEV